MAETFDIRNFGATMREIIVVRINQLVPEGQAGADTFWRAQQEVTTLRARLERAVRSAGQKAKRMEREPVELWCFGCAAYKLITEDGVRIEDVTRMSGAKLLAAAIECSQPIIEQAAPLMGALAEASKNGEPDEALRAAANRPFLFEKLSREHGEENAG